MDSSISIITPETPIFTLPEINLSVFFVIRSILLLLKHAKKFTILNLALFMYKKIICAICNQNIFALWKDLVLIKKILSTTLSSISHHV